MSRLPNKIFGETTLMLKYIYILKKIYPIINYTNRSTLKVHYLTKLISISTPSRQSLVQDKDRADFKELRFISSLSTCEYSLTGPSSFEGWSRDRAKSSEVINENEMRRWGKRLYQPGLMHVITEIRYTILVTPVTNKPML